MGANQQSLNCNPYMSSSFWTHSRFHQLRSLPICDLRHHYPALSFFVDTLQWHRPPNPLVCFDRLDPLAQTPPPCSKTLYMCTTETPNDIHHGLSKWTWIRPLTWHNQPGMAEWKGGIIRRRRRSILFPFLDDHPKKLPSLYPLIVLVDGVYQSSIFGLNFGAAFRGDNNPMWILIIVHFHVLLHPRTVTLVSI